MPYIPQQDRKTLDPLIDALAEQVAAQARERADDSAFAGLLNYACTRLALETVRMRFGTMRYHLIAILTGVFHNVADELYRRVGAPYEDRQIARHGDVDAYVAWLEDVEQR